MYVPHPLYHSSVDGQCFHVLAIVNSASVNTRVHVSFQSRVFPDICPELGLLDHMVALFLVFSGNSILFSIADAPIYTPTNSVGGSELIFFNRLTQYTHTHMLISWPLFQLCAWVLSRLCHVWLFATLQTVACQAPLAMGIFQARIMEWVTVPSSRGSSRPRDWTSISCLVHGQVDSLPLVPPGKPSWDLQFENSWLRGQLCTGECIQSSQFPQVWVIQIMASPRTIDKPVP